MELLKGKVCIVTGCGRGIGAAVTEKFASEGAVVYGVERQRGGSIEEKFKELSERYATEVIPLYLDVTDEEASKQVFMKVRKERGRLDVLVNNAGIMKDALIGMVDSKLMNSIFAVNVFAVMNWIQLAYKLMGRQNSGSIINLSSIVGVEGNAGQLVYSASKGAVAAMTKTAAKELAPKGIRVNAIAPGMIDTDMFRSIGEEKEAEYLKNIRMGRLGTPQDVANAILFFASDLSAYVTGQILGVTGSAMI